MELSKIFRRRRRLRATGAGRALIAITFAVGFAAFNTGNNLLFFGWGLLLSSIVISGILSESTLRAVRADPLVPPELRARANARLPVALSNVRRTPSFAVQLELGVDAPRGAVIPSRAFALRVDAGGRRHVDTHFMTSSRGRHVVRRLRLSTAFPFGFFEKDKLVELEHPLALVVLPARLDVESVRRDMLARLGDSPARRVGPGDELFSLRPFRAGDDPRRVAWRRAAKSGRLVVRETEAQRARDVIIDVALAGAASLDDAEHAVAVAASLAEDLLHEGHAVGLRAPGCALVPAAGPRQRSAVLHALALLDDAAAVPLPPARNAMMITVVASGARAPADAGVIVDAGTISARPPIKEAA